MLFSTYSSPFTRVWAEHWLIQLATKLCGSLPRSFVQLLGPQSWVLNYTINAGVTISNAASWCGTWLVALHSWMSWGWVPRVPWNVSQQTYNSIKRMDLQASSSSLHTEARGMRIVTDTNLCSYHTQCRTQYVRSSRYPSVLSRPPA